MITFFDIWVSKRYLLPKTKDSFFSIITIFSFLGISLGVATLIIVMSVMNGFREELTSKVLGINGQMKVKLYNNQKINNYENIVSLLKETNPLVTTHPTILSQGLINFKNLSTGVLIKGLEIENLKERKLLSNKLSKDTLSEYKKNNGILVGNRLKEKFNLKKNDFVNLISPQGFKTPFGKLTTSQNYKIIGFFETGMYEYDLSLIIMPLKNLQTFLGVNRNQVDSIEIFVNDFKSVNQFSKNIKNIIPKYYEVVDWRELNPSLFNAIEVERNVMFLILFLIILVAAFNLISSMIMLVNNKKKDIGILRTLGVTKYQLLKIFIINGFSIGLIGTFLGVILGISFCLNINEIKSFLELLTDSNLFAEEIYFFSKLPIIINLNEIILIISIALTLSFLATIYPSYKASKIEPIHLIKWE